MEAFFKELTKFYMDFADKLVIFDPIDRAIPDADNDQTIKRNDLIVKINEMPSIVGFVLNAPMSNERGALLDKMFDYEIKICNDIAQQYLDEAQV